MIVHLACLTNSCELREFSISAISTIALGTSALAMLQCMVSVLLRTRA